MRTLRLLIACVILFGARVVAEVIAGPDLGSEKTQVRPVERMLIGSIIGLGIATLWIWFSARAGR